MKLIRKVEWNEEEKRYKVKWILDLGEDIIEDMYRVNLKTWYVEFKREEEEEGNIYRARSSYADEDVANIEEDTRRIVEAIREAVKKSREHASIAERLSTEIEFDVE